MVSPSPMATRVGDGIVEVVTGFMVSHCRMVLSDPVCYGRLWLWLRFIPASEAGTCMPVVPMVCGLY